MAKQLKWKRASTGRYETTDGRWTIKKAKSGMWHLIDNLSKERVGEFSQKKSGQNHAAERDSEAPKAKKSPPLSKKKVIVPTVSLDDLQVEAVSKRAVEELTEREPEFLIPKLPVPLDFPGARNLDSILASFRLEVARLTDTIGMLAAAITKLEKEIAKKR